MIAGRLGLGITAHEARVWRVRLLWWVHQRCGGLAVREESTPLLLLLLLKGLVNLVVLLAVGIGRVWLHGGWIV